MRLLRLHICAAVTSSVISATAVAGGVSFNHGLDDLIARLGAGNEPTGAGILVGQVEADSGGNYGPDIAHAEFAGKTFTFVSGATGISGHATQVGRRVYGTGTSGLAPNLDQIYVYSATGWVQGNFLQLGSVNDPSSPPFGLKLFNNSWIGSFGNIALTKETLRRADWAIDMSNVVMINGVANSGAHSPLMSFGFNCISVGMENGTHVSGVVPANYDTVGCQIPLIVASQGTTSNATGVVTAATALLLETQQTHPNTSGNFLASLSETIKAVLLTGGNHLAGWTNNPTISGANRGRTSQPIDAVFGVGTVNIDRAHLVMSGGQHASSDVTTGLPVAPHAAWETWTISSNQSRYIKYNVATLADEVSIVLTWHQTPINSFSSYSIADLDLILWKYANGALVDITGKVGADVFAGGNVVSESAVDNVEHLFIQGLAAGEYVLEIRRNDVSGIARVFSVGWLFPEPTGVLGDIDGNGVVDVNDLLVLIGSWGTCPASCPADLTGDGNVNVLDILLLLSYW